jgi:hypothetical protein
MVKIAVALGLALAVGVGGTLALDRTLLESDAFDGISEGDICGGSVTDDVAVVKRNLDSGSAVTSTWTDSRSNDSLSESCWVKSSGGGKLGLTADLRTGGVAEWKTYMKGKVDGDFDDQLSFGVGADSVSWDMHAGIYVKCTLPQPVKNDDGSLASTYISVLVRGVGSVLKGNEEHRKDLAFLAIKLAGHAHDAMGCKEDLNVSDGEPELKKTS